MSIQPQGEELRKAVQWINSERVEDPAATLPELVEKACLKFDLSPLDAAYLQRFFAEQKNDRG